MVYNNGSFLPGSVVLCYFASLASVYGNSVALLRAQLKLVSCWYSVECCIPKQILSHRELCFTNSIFGLQEGRDKQFLVKQIEMLCQQLHISKPSTGAQD